MMLLGWARGGFKYKWVKTSQACVPTPAVRSFCQCEILLIATHLQWGGACGDSVLAGGLECHLSQPRLTFYCRCPEVKLFPHWGIYIKALTFFELLSYFRKLRDFFSAKLKGFVPLKHNFKTILVMIWSVIMGRIFFYQNCFKKKHLSSSGRCVNYLWQKSFRCRLFTLLIMTTRCCFQSSLMGFYLRVLFITALPHLHSNTLYVPAWYAINYCYQGSVTCVGFSMLASPFQFLVVAWPP